MSARLFARLTGALAILIALAGSASAQGEAELAAAKFLAEQKGLATQKIPQEQWFATYAGPYWASATRVSVVEKDADAGGMRRIDYEKVTTRDRDNAAREIESWWIDASGAVVKGERRFFDEHADQPKEVTRYEAKGGKLKKTSTFQEEGEAKADEPRDLDQPSAFVPDEIFAALLVPPSKGTTWKFSTFETAEKFVTFTITDEGDGKAIGRKGEVAARRLTLKEKESEVTIWLDADHRLIASVGKDAPNLLTIGGTAEECHEDWSARPADDVDAATDKLAQGLTEKLAGELFYALCDAKGHATRTVQATLKKEDKDGKPAFHYMATTAVIGTQATVVEDWWVAADGSPLSGAGRHDDGSDKKTFTAKVDGGRFVVAASDAEESEKPASYPIARHFVPDSMFFALRSLAKEEKGTFRFSTLDMSADPPAPFSIWLEVKGMETVKVRSGEVKAKHVHLAQNGFEGNCWIDEGGKLLLVRWEDGEMWVGASSLDEAKKDVKSLGKQDEGDE